MKSVSRKAIGFGALTAALALCLLLTAEQISHGPSFCVFRLGTGIDCPGCGMTRALSALLHGDIEGAIRYHPLVVVVFPVLAAIWISLFTELVWRKELFSSLPPRVIDRFSIALVSMFLCVWVFRTAVTLSHVGLGFFEHSIFHRLAQAVY